MYALHMMRTQLSKDIHTEYFLVRPPQIKLALVAEINTGSLCINVIDIVKARCVSKQQKKNNAAVWQKKFLPHKKEQ